MTGRLRKGILHGGLVLIGIALHMGWSLQQELIAKASRYDEQIAQTAEFALGLPGGKKR